MYKLLIPLFALAFLLVSCSPAKPSTPPSAYKDAAYQNLAPSPKKLTPDMFKFDGQILSGKHVVILHTTKGDVTLELDADAAPRTVTNFVTLAKNGFFDGLTFHRVIPGFMVQAGDPNGDGTGGKSIFGDTFADEINADSYHLTSTPSPEDPAKTVKQYLESKGYHFNSAFESLPMTRGALAMANRGADTNGSQFFIIQGDETPWLNGRHTVFGRVTEGMDVVDAIAGAERDQSDDRPLQPITFTAEVKN